MASLSYKNTTGFVTVLIWKSAVWMLSCKSMTVILFPKILKVLISQQINQTVWRRRVPLSFDQQFLSQLYFLIIWAVLICVWVFLSLWLNVCFVCVFQGERIEKGQGTWDPSEEPPHDVISLSWLIFLLVPETFYKRNIKKTKTKKKHQNCDYYYFCSVTGSTIITCTTAFFTYLFFPLTWLGSESENIYGTMTKFGAGVGGQNICFAAFFALFHGLLCRFSDMKRFLNDSGSEFRRHLRRSVESEDPESRKPSSRKTGETTQKRSGLKFLFIFS